MDADLQAQNDLDSLLSRLGDQVHDCRARVKDNTLKLGSSGNQILKGLRLYTDSVGALTIALGCPECQFVGYEASGVCQLCGGWGETRLTVDLVADTLQDEVQLAAKYLLVLLMERGQMDYMRHDFPRPPTLNTMDRHLEECVAVDRPDEGHSPPRWLDEQGEHDVELWEGLLQREDGQNTEQSRNHELQEPHHQLEELCASQDSDNLDDEDDEADEEDEVSEDYYYDFYESPSDVAVDLKSLSRYGPEDLVKLKTAMLAPNLLRRVRKVTKLQCEHDPDWVLQLLYDASQHLEELQLHTPARSHVEVMESMPRLMRLDIEYFASEARSSEDFIFRKPPARHRGLRWLRVKGLSMRSTFSLLRAHRRTLEEMWVAVGSWRKTADDEDVKNSCAPSFSDEGWPTSCRDLDQRLSRVGQVPQLQRLVLYRWFNAHDPITCMRQIAAVRNVLPGVNVQCFECDGLTMQKL